jgi:hypothetical protein
VIFFWRLKNDFTLFKLMSLSVGHDLLHFAAVNIIKLPKVMLFSAENIIFCMLKVEYRKRFLHIYIYRKLGGRKFHQNLHQRLASE